MPKSNDESLCRHWKTPFPCLFAAHRTLILPSFPPSEQRIYHSLFFLPSPHHQHSSFFLSFLSMAALNPNAPLYVSLVHNYGLHLPVYPFNYFQYPLYPSNKSWWFTRVTYLQHPPPPPPPAHCQYYQHVNEMQEKDARTVDVCVKNQEIKAKGKRSRQSKAMKVKAAAAKEPEKDIQEAGVVVSKKITTLMIRNLPNKFDQDKVLGLLDEHCKKVNEKIQQDDNGTSPKFSEFDFLYLPIDFRF